MFTLVAGAIGAFAFAPAPAPTNVKAKSGDTMRHFFDAISGEYLGPKLESQQQAECGTLLQQDCAYGYNSITTDENDEIVPVGSSQYTAQKAL